MGSGEGTYSFPFSIPHSRLYLLIVIRVVVLSLFW